MNLENVYMWAKAMNWHDFKSLVAKEIDNTPPTVENNNEYVVVNKNDLLSDVGESVCSHEWIATPPPGEIMVYCKKCYKSK